LNHFTAQFLGPVEDELAEDNFCESKYYEILDPEEELDDGLGYYSDGVKRTLTDEQIAIFRHSEIQAILREQRHEEEAKEEEEIDDSPPAPVQELTRPIIGPMMERADFEDGELEDNLTKTATPSLTNDKMPTEKKPKKKKKSQKAHQRDPKVKGFFKQNVKPDLRKRTWDKVDQGVEGLEYDEIIREAADMPSITKRRQISYDD
jgi:hypothetical protein